MKSGWRERDSNARLVVMSHARGLVTAPVIPRNGAEAANSSAAPAYIRPGAIVLAESRGPEPHTFRCHRCSKPSRRACPVDSPKWRTAEALIPSAEAPTRFPIEAGGAPVHCPNGGVTAGLHRNASRAPYDLFLPSQIPQSINI